MFPRIRVVFTRQLEILVTALYLNRSLRAGIPCGDCAAISFSPYSFLPSVAFPKISQRTSRSSSAKGLR